MMKMKMLMTAALMMTAAATYAGDNVLPSWALGGFVRPQGVNPLVSPIADSRFLCPMTGESVKWECADTFNPAAVVRDGQGHPLRLPPHEGPRCRPPTRSVAR